MKKYNLADRGFIGYEFTDLYGSKCSIQESSLATDNAIWLGVNKDFKGKECTRMHLNIEQVKELLPQLRYFIKRGVLNKNE